MIFSSPLWGSTQVNTIINNVLIRNTNIQKGSTDITSNKYAKAKGKILSLSQVYYVTIFFCTYCMKESLSPLKCKRATQ